ncbi:MAG: T9SS type A sorting domain-containing protein [Saprospiraceae bacterium]|nr:T9SS type A sorting domain-containing protein [Saprospiraceae bacterium]HMW39336.1 T9SS type A sorting domain-containing protein [Saprospiraceae bacterium]HMX88646.1 T9SS type A sorting domain-containing protein [Saprospiraceae bacterium]HMZ40225.1 T9SS type A sorting domain-containing protein [Saprospiraceae bacterium]HNB30445.1 T9SS type A sorting domain-containing protein [Saprospiraceae bacterium]
MKKTCFLILLLIHSLSRTDAQTLVSDTLLGGKTSGELIAQFNFPFIQYGVNYYRITYTTQNVHGVTDTVSGLVVIPADTSKMYPRLVYTHGFASLKLDVPSFNVTQNGGEGSIGLLFGGLGFISLLPDYLGMGLGKGFHPAFHAASEALTSADMLRALKQFAALHNVHFNNQLFITGYSEGGHASMALHQLIQTRLSGEFAVTAATHLSGPYSMGEVMRQWTLNDSINNNVAWIPLTVLSYQEAYGNIYTNLSEVFKAPYFTPIGQYLSGMIDAGQMGSQLATLLITIEGSIRPFRMLQPAFQQAVLADPNHPYNIDLKRNNTYNWVPLAPMRIYYCSADEVIPYQNGVLALDTMIALGATNVSGSDVNSGAGHLDCVTPALTNTVFFFLPLRQIDTYVSTTEQQQIPILMEPNPAHQSVTLSHLNANGHVSIVDLNGQLMYNEDLHLDQITIDLSGFENGVFVIRYLSNGKTWQGKLVHYGF